MFNPIRKRQRLKEYDYSNPKWYCVTICTQNSKNLFVRILLAKMKMNTCGEIAEKNWKLIEGLNNYIKIDEYIIMPNHIHGIIIINNLVVA